MAKFLLVSFLLTSSGVPNYYETYRAQLFRHFLSKGRSEGTGIPAARLRVNVPCNHGYFMQQHCSANDRHSGELGMLDWEDGTVHLAFSLATFSTEFLICGADEACRQESLQRIGDGLAALDRLDSGSFSKFGLPPALDGLFLRDDAVADIYSEYQQVNCVRSGSACFPGANRRNLSSQDQYVYLSLGLASVLHALPDTVVDPVSGKSLKNWALQTGLRMGSRWISDDWRIRTPHGEPVHLGQWIHFSSWPLYKWYRKELNGLDFHGFPGSAGRLVWQIQLLMPFDSANPLSSEVNLGMSLALTALNGRGLSLVMEKSLRSNMVLFYLWGCWLHSKSPHPLAVEALEQILLEAPSDGAGFFPVRAAAKGWRSENRWFHPERYEGMEWEAECLFNGLDYMLAFNIFRLLKEGL